MKIGIIGADSRKWEKISDGVKKAKITIDSGAVNIKISGSTDKLVTGSFESDQSKPTIKEVITGDTIEYTIKTDKSFESLETDRLQTLSILSCPTLFQ